VTVWGSKLRRHRWWIAMAAAALLGGLLAAPWFGPPPATTRGSDDLVLAVLPFRMAGADPSLAYLQEGMLDLLWARFTGDVGPRMMDPGVVLTLYHQLHLPADTDPTEEQTAKLATAVGARRVLTGSVAGTPDRLVITVTVKPVARRSAASQRWISNATASGPADSLPALVDRLWSQLLAMDAGITTGGYGLASRPLGAVQAFLRGRSERRAGRYDRALASFQRAMEIDSTFALAALEATMLAGWTMVPNLPELEELIWAHRDQLSKRDLLIAEVRGLLPLAPKPAAERLAMTERAVAVIPSDPELWETLADIYFHLGAALGIPDPWDRAEAALRAALTIDPTRGGALQHAIHIAAVRGDLAGLRPLAARYFRQDSTSELSIVLRWLVAVVRGDAVTRSKIRGAFDSALYLGVDVADIGQTDGIGLEDAGPALAASRRRASTPDERAMVQLRSAFLALNQGHPAEAESYLDAIGSQDTRMMAGLFWDGDSLAAAKAAREVQQIAAQPAPSDAAGNSMHARAVCLDGVWHVTRGDDAYAQGVAQWLRMSIASADTTIAASAGRVCLKLLETVALTHRGDSAAPAALASLDSLSRTGPVFWQAIPLNLIIATLYERMGDLPAAVAALHRRPYWYGVFSGPSYLTSYLEREGRLRLALGDTSGAIAAFEHYLLLRDAPDAPLQSAQREIRDLLLELSGDHDDSGP
jgi:tetratricopeptide (TPR) repeat protein